MNNPNWVNLNQQEFHQFSLSLRQLAPIFFWGKLFIYLFIFEPEKYDLNTLTKDVCEKNKNDTNLPDFHPKKSPDFYNR
jgi:hypothetical protein